MSPEQKPLATGAASDPRARETYVRRLLERYRQTPGTLGRIRSEDRVLAAELHRRGVPLEHVEAAFNLAAARRIFREADAMPLQPIRSLHYFLPVLEEIQTANIDPGYLAYVEHKLNAHLSTRPSDRR
jgi:hypothetical protein